MKRERIEELKNWAQFDFYSSGDCPGEFPGSQDEFMELADLALRATDPDMVMVPKETVHNFAYPGHYEGKPPVQEDRERLKEILAAAQEGQP